MFFLPCLLPGRMLKQNGVCENRLTAESLKLTWFAAQGEGKKMLKHQRQGGAAATGIFLIFWKPTLVILFAFAMLLLSLCIFNSFLIFHLSSSFIPKSASLNGSINSSSFVLLNRSSSDVLQVIREENPHINITLPCNNHTNGVYVLEARKNQEQNEEEKDPIVSLDKPPLNVSEEERIKWFTRNLKSFKILHSDSLSSHFNSKAKSLFQNCSLQFFMTWISNPEDFGPREILSVESVFKWHPSACLLIISRSMDSERGKKILKPFVSKGFHVMAAAPDLTYLFKGTAAATWLKKVKAGKIDPGEISFAQNLSNIIRLAALHLYGGIYMDSDVIILKSMAKLENAIGAQSVDQLGHWNRLNNAVLIFKKRHPLVKEFMKEFARNFNGNKWGFNGPYLVTRVAKRVSKQSKIRFQVRPLMAFYPFDWMRIHGYFRRNTGEKRIRWPKAKLLQIEGETYAVHLWNKESRQLQVEEGSVIHHIFKKCCILCLDEQYLHNNSTL